MKALFISCTLKKSPEPSNTEALATVVTDALRERGVTVENLRLADLNVPPGVLTDVGDGDAWPGVHERLLDAQILVVVTPTWLGRPSSIGYTVPGEAWTYWNQGPGPGADYPQTEHGHEWSHSTGRLMAHNLYSVASALAARPVPPPRT